jgi:hypothetical protein
MLNRRWLSLNGAERYLCVQANIEEHDPARIAEFLQTWRSLRPFATTSLAIEGFQGGWLQQIRQQIIDSRVVVVPEAYGDLPGAPMSLYDTDGVVQDLLQVGIPASQVVPFHDAARLFRGWRGFAFLQSRLT